jgi:hypothetical protein
VHVAPTCAGSGEESDHFGSFVRSLSLHFCKRLFPGLEPVTSWSQGNSLLLCQGSPSCKCSIYFKKCVLLSTSFLFSFLYLQLCLSDLNLIYACSRDKTLMIDVQAREITERDLQAGMKLAHFEVLFFVLYFSSHDRCILLHSLIT